MTFIMVLPAAADLCGTRRWFALTAITASMQATLIATASAQASAPVGVAPVVITGTRIAADPFTLPMAINVIDGEAIQEGQLQVNGSAAIRVPVMTTGATPTGALACADAVAISVA